MPAAVLAAGVISKMLLVASSGSAYPSSMPLMPAARITENARYGLQAGSGERNSMRVEDSLPLRPPGTRTSADRLLRAHATYTGASLPGATTRRLYEFTHWLVM